MRSTCPSLAPARPAQGGDRRRDARVLSDYARTSALPGSGQTPAKLAPATIARKLAAVRAFLRFTLGASRVPRPASLPAPAPAGRDAERRDRRRARPLWLRMTRSPSGTVPRRLVYSAGLRSQEAVDLDLADVEFEQEAVRIRGKGGKERVVPLGEEAAFWIARWLRERPKLARGAQDALFISARGNRLDTSTLRRLFPHPHRSATPSRSSPGRAGPTCGQSELLGHSSSRPADVQPRRRRRLRRSIPSASAILARRVPRPLGGATCPPHVEAIPA